MRTVYVEVLKAEFRNHVMIRREELNLSQAKMSELLEISERAYSDIESGKSCCSALTLALYLIFCCDDVQGFLDELKARIEKANEEAA